MQGRSEAGTRTSALTVFTPSDIPILTAIPPKLEGKTRKQKNHHPPGALA